MKGGSQYPEAPRFDRHGQSHFSAAMSHVPIKDPRQEFGGACMIGPQQQADRKAMAERPQQISLFLNPSAVRARRSFPDHGPCITTPPEKWKREIGGERLLLSTSFFGRRTHIYKTCPGPELEIIPAPCTRALDTQWHTLLMTPLSPVTCHLTRD